MAGFSAVYTPWLLPLSCSPSLRHGHWFYLRSHLPTPNTNTPTTPFIRFHKLKKKKSIDSRRSSYDKDGDCEEDDSSECDDDDSSDLINSSIVGGLGGYGGGPGRGGGGRQMSRRSSLRAPPPPPQAKPAMAQVEGGSGGMGAVSFVVDKPADIK